MKLQVKTDSQWRLKKIVPPFFSTVWSYKNFFLIPSEHSVHLLMKTSTLNWSTRCYRHQPDVLPLAEWLVTVTTEFGYVCYLAVFALNALKNTWHKYTFEKNKVLQVQGCFFPWALFHDEVFFWFGEAPVRQPLQTSVCAALLCNEASEILVAGSVVAI